MLIVGDPALPQLHEALGASTTDEAQRVRLINVIGEIGSPSSTVPLIRAAESRADGGYHRPVFFALALVPPSPESLAFAEAQLAVGVAQTRQIAALVYLAQIRHPPAAELVARFTDPSLPPRLRSVGFYPGARLGVPGIVSRIGEALLETSDRSDLETLLSRLAYAAPSRAELERLATAAGFNEQSFTYRDSLVYCAFRTAPEQSAEKIDLAYQVLETGSTWYRREALRYLIAADPQSAADRLTGGFGQFLPLHQLMPLSATVQLLFSESRRMGYRLELTDEGYALTPSADPPPLA